MGLKHRSVWIGRAAAVAGAAILLGVSGCQEEVVGVRNPASDGRWDYEMQPSSNQMRGGGNGPLEAVGEGLDGMGDLLFGWMKSDNSVTYTPGPAEDVDLGNRYGPTVRSGE